MVERSTYGCVLPWGILWIEIAFSIIMMGSNSWTCRYSWIRVTFDWIDFYFMQFSDIYEVWVICKLILQVGIFKNAYEYMYTYSWINFRGVIYFFISIRNIFHPTFIDCNVQYIINIIGWKWGGIEDVSNNKSFSLTRRWSLHSSIDKLVHVF